MKQIVAPSSFADHEAARRYIAQCEGSFRRRVIELADEFSAIRGLRLIGLSGPTCAGKTTTASLLVGHLEGLGHRVHVISVDDFFHEQPHDKRAMNADQTIDFDSIEALDFELFADSLDSLMSTGRANIPRFDLSTGCRMGYRELISSDESDIFLVEGIQVVYPEISALLRRYTYRCIFSNVSTALSVGGVVYSPEQIRLLRRIVRDYYFRSSDAAFTYYLWDSVRANEENNIFPNAASCDVQLDSLMGYEIGMLRPHLEIILGNLPLSNAHRADADAVFNHISGVQPLHPSWLPSDALYREFVPLG